MTARLALAAWLAVAGAAWAQDEPPAEPPAPPPPAAPEPAPAPPPAWLQRAGADLVALDKVSARTTPLTVAIGQEVRFRTLTIGVRACVTRPPDQAPDAAAFVDVTDATPGAPEFHGWLVRSAPAVSGMQHPAYDVRLSGCR